MTISPYTDSGHQWAWNSTALGDAKTCKRYYYYRQIMGYSDTKLNPNIIFGSHYAKACERYHRYISEGMTHTEALHTTVVKLLFDAEGWEPDVDSKWANTKNRDTLLRSVIWYLEEFGADDNCKTVILASGEPAVELTFQFKVRDDITLCGHLDRLVDYSGDYYVQDQKTTGSQLGAYYFNRFNPDNQMSLYTYASQVIWKVPVKGVMIDAAQIAVGFTRFSRFVTHRTNEQLTEWLKTAIYHIEETWRCHDINFWPMNDKACQLYGSCPFLEVCSKDPRMEDAYLAGFERHHNNPLEDRRAA